MVEFHVKLIQKPSIFGQYSWQKRKRSKNCANDRSAYIIRSTQKKSFEILRRTQQIVVHFILGTSSHIFVLFLKQRELEDYIVGQRRRQQNFSTDPFFTFPLWTLSFAISYTFKILVLHKLSSIFLSVDSSLMDFRVYS